MPSASIAALRSSALSSALLTLALGACVASVSLHDAGLTADHDPQRPGWTHLSSLRYGVSLTLPGRPIVDEVIDDARLDHEGVVLLVPGDAETRRSTEVRMILTERDDDDAAHVLAWWREQMFTRARGQLEREETLDVAAHPGLLLHYTGIGVRRDDEIWMIAGTDGHSIVEVVMQNPEMAEEEARPASLEHVRASIAFVR